MYGLVIFDLGETLVNYKGLSLNWSEHYSNALMYACDNLSIHYDDTMIEKASSVLLKYNTRVNPRKQEVAAQIIFEEIISVLNTAKDYCEPLIEKFFEYFQRDAEVEDTAKQLFVRLKQLGIKSAVLTDVPYGMPKRIVLKDLEPIMNELDYVLTSVEVGYRKPLTIGLEKIISYFNISKDEVMYIGNEQKDILMANTSGVFSVLINPRNEFCDWRQKKNISRLIEIESLLV